MLAVGRRGFLYASGSFLIVSASGLTLGCGAALARGVSKREMEEIIALQLEDLHLAKNFYRIDESVDGNVGIYNLSDQASVIPVTFTITGNRQRIEDQQQKVVELDPGGNSTTPLPPISPKAAGPKAYTVEVPGAKLDAPFMAVV